MSSSIHRFSIDDRADAIAFGLEQMARGGRTVDKVEDDRSITLTVTKLTPLESALSAATLALVEAFGQAAASQYYEQDQGSPSTAAQAEKDYAEARAELIAHLIQLERGQPFVPPDRSPDA